MKTRFASLFVVLVGLLALLLMPFVGSPKPAAATGSFYYDFESTLAPWVPASHYTIEQYGSYALQRSDDDNSCPSDGDWYANLGIDVGNFSRAKTWIVAAYEGTGPSTYNSVAVSWKAKNKVNCDPDALPCSAGIYIGTTAPNSTSSFVDKGLIENYWTTKSHSQGITLDDNNTIYVALSWRNTFDGQDPVPAPDQQIGIDCIDIDITTDSLGEP